MKKTSVYIYEGASINFLTENGEVMVNATEMAKPFGKRVYDWMITQQSKEFIRVLSETRNLASADLMKVTKGGDVSNQGTWFHKDVAIEFARWLAPKFGIWCNDRILELMQHGVTAINPEDLLNPDMMIKAMEALKAERAEKERLRIQTEIQAKELSQAAPKVEYYDDVLESDGLMATTMIAQELNVSAITLNRWLRRDRIIRTVGGITVLYQDYLNKGFVDYKTYKYTDKKGNTVSTQHLYWLQPGRKFILDKYGKNR